jgi:hypothetical protein
MIRQLGIPTFFLTLSAAESNWPELLIALKHTADEELWTEEQVMNELSLEEKHDLIRNDPVTCARYFDHLMKAMFGFLRSEGSPFVQHETKYPLVDSYQRTEFQHRGSPHTHNLLWLKGSPVFNGSVESAAECVEFIDKFISCSGEDIDDALLKLQTHKHTHSCKKGNKGKKCFCRYGFPQPPMSKTQILEPLPKNSTGTIEHQTAFSNIAKYLAQLSKDLGTLWNKAPSIKDLSNNVLLNMTFEEFLTKLNLTEEKYILAIRSSLRKAKVIFQISTTIKLITFFLIYRSF